MKIIINEKQFKMIIESDENIRNIITKTNDYNIYENAFNDAYSNIDEDYSISFDYGDIEKTFSDLGKTETVDVDYLVSPQTMVNSKTVNEYINAKNFNGSYGVKFQGNDEEVMVVDGNHKINAAIKSGESAVKMKVITIPFNS